MAETWKMIRVRFSTFVLVEAARQRMQDAYERGQLPINDPANGGRVSLDTAVFLLATRDQMHDVRRKRHAAKKRVKQKPAAESGPAAGANPE